jgi:AraC-like DNA-binding protein
MLANAVDRREIAPNASRSSALSLLFTDEREVDMPGVLIPRPEVHLVVRFGPSTRDGLDVYALGARQRVHRKFIRRGQRTVTARLQLGAHEAVLGVPASALSGQIIALEDLWGDAAARILADKLSETKDTDEAAQVLQRAISERFAHEPERRVGVRLALAAASRLLQSNVNTVARDLGVSERHLRRVFIETVGVNPKVFAQLSRFRRALRAARSEHQPNWASIAATTGYYDQAHLISEFRSISAATPRALLDELRTAWSVG